MSSELDMLPMERLNRADIKDAATALGIAEIRFLVDTYYQWQDQRVRAALQIRDLAKADEPHAVLRWTSRAYARVEGDLQAMLDRWSDQDPLATWAKSIYGIGPVLSCGLRAHIDVRKAPTVGHIWSFAGLNPEQKWEKGQKRPWNARLKVLCWKLGDSFVKFHNRPKDIYGKVYKARKVQELERNEAGLFAKQAADTLLIKKIKDPETLATYKAGKLPLGRLENRARRYAVKLFLAHYHHVAYEIEFGTPPPKPYVIDQLGHAHFIGPPNWK